MCQQTSSAITNSRSSSSSSSTVTTPTALQQQQQQQQQSTTTDTQCPTKSSPSTRKAQMGDIVTIDFQLTPEHGYVPHPLFDTSGTNVTFVLGWGNYLPGLHTLIEGMVEGESLDNTTSPISIDAGWGKRKQELIVTVPKSALQKMTDLSVLRVGRHLHLEGDIRVLVTAVTDTHITVDANPPLAGTSYRATHLTVTSVASMAVSDETSSKSEDSNFQIATFGLGCFWGAQLAFSRVHGVVGTQTGYTQGISSTPTYEQVCEGTTRHVEAVTVVYDPNVVSYQQLLQVAMERLEQQQNGGKKAFSLNQHDLAWLFGDDDDESSSRQYRHGFYFHNAEQEEVATTFLSALNNKRYRIELQPATPFYKAEEYHQHYLLKGGQSARKGAKETIRCFG